MTCTRTAERAAPRNHQPRRSPANLLREARVDRFWTCVIFIVFDVMPSVSGRVRGFTCCDRRRGGPWAAGCRRRDRRLNLLLGGVRGWIARSNCSVITTEAPPELIERHLLEPGICPNWRSAGR
jgi:hypothetical protein